LVEQRRPGRAICPVFIFLCPFIHIHEAMKMRKTFIIPVLALLASCGRGMQDTPTDEVQQTVTEVEPFDPTAALARYDVERYFPGDSKDTLLANMITFIYKRPAVATQQTRTEPQFRSYYVESLSLFEYAYHGIGPDSAHYFYLIRPARSLEGTLRGVGGRFTTRGGTALVEFEEILNTRIGTREKLLEHGVRFMEEALSAGRADAMIEDREVTEWPDERLKYSKSLREWRYVD